MGDHLFNINSLIGIHIQHFVHQIHEFLFPQILKFLQKLYNILYLRQFPKLLAISVIKVFKHRVTCTCIFFSKRCPQKQTLKQCNSQCKNITLFFIKLLTSKFPFHHPQNLRSQHCFAPMLPVLLLNFSVSGNPLSPEPEISYFCLLLFLKQKYIFQLYIIVNYLLGM